MRRALFLFMLLACNKTDTQTTTSASASAPAATPPAPFTGALTGDRVMGAKDLAHPFDPWESAQAKLQAQMGHETYTKDDKVYWAVSQGDDCWYMMAQKQKDGTVGMVQSPMKVSKGGAIINWDDCLVAAGVRKEVAEDPNAPGPPTDGKPISLASLIDGATKGRSKWSGTKLSATAVYSGTSTSTSGDKTYKSLMLVPAKGDSKSVTCSLADANAPLPTFKGSDPITVSGTVKVDDMIGSTGRSLSVRLDECSVVKVGK